MHRRGFIAVSAVTAAASSVTGMPILGHTARSLRFARPELVELRPHEVDATRVIATRPSSLFADRASIAAPQIELSPLACTESRIASDAAVDIEMHHPASGIDSILYSAHKAGLGAFPAGISSPIRPDAAGGLTLIVTQRLGELRQQHKIRIDATRAGSYLLAIPTSPDARAPVWRTSTISINESQTPTQVRSLFEARARSCMLMSVRITESESQIEGANHAG
ncbi:MAG: hypothetical protein KDA29_03915 [Phycisphaerales bacterium]|nr:hypothetical protein [Phycisphaerales bacterium]